VGGSLKRHKAKNKMTVDHTVKRCGRKKAIYQIKKCI
jgi:hypothetical protein